MSLSEFEIIQRYFNKLTAERDDVKIGIGDDCAVLHSDANIVVTVDTLVDGVHFDDTTPVSTIGYKCVAVSLSDLAAMGASPAWITLSLTLPEYNEDWLREFCSGLQECCSQFGVALVGGNMSRGPLTISTQLIGKQVGGKSLLRSGALVGDDIYVSGRIGEAGLGLLLHQAQFELPKQYKSDLDYLKARWLMPTPRITLGKALLELATSCIDISDGLAADINHMVCASKASASLQLERLPLYENFQSVKNQVGGWQQPISAGEDYELCFSSNPSQREVISALAVKQNIKITRIGSINPGNGVNWTLNNEVVELNTAGYQHF